MKFFKAKSNDDIFVFVFFSLFIPHRFYSVNTESVNNPYYQKDWQIKAMLFQVKSCSSFFFFFSEFVGSASVFDA